MKDFRCKKCNRKLASYGRSSYVLIKCPRCKTFNELKGEPPDDQESASRENTNRDRPED
jgi:phage FluMu protein Com